MGWENRFPERKDTGGGGKLQFNGAVTPPLPPSPTDWPNVCSASQEAGDSHLLCGSRDALRSPKINFTPLSGGLQSEQFLYIGQKSDRAKGRVGRDPGSHCSGRCISWSSSRDRKSVV